MAGSRDHPGAGPAAAAATLIRAAAKGCIRLGMLARLSRLKFPEGRDGDIQMPPAPPPRRPALHPASSGSTGNSRAALGRTAIPSAGVSRRPYGYTDDLRAEPAS